MSNVKVENSSIPPSILEMFDEFITELDEFLNSLDKSLLDGSTKRSKKTIQYRQWVEEQLELLKQKHCVVLAYYEALRDENECYRNIYKKLLEGYNLEE